MYKGNPKMFSNQMGKKAKSGGSAKVMSTNVKTPVTPPLQSTNKSSRKNSTDYRPQPK